MILISDAAQYYLYHFDTAKPMICNNCNLLIATVYRLLIIVNFYDSERSSVPSMFGSMCLNLMGL